MKFIIQHLTLDRQRGGAGVAFTLNVQNDEDLRHLANAESWLSSDRIEQLSARLFEVVEEELYRAAGFVLEEEPPEDLASIEDFDDEDKDL